MASRKPKRNARTGEDGPSAYTVRLRGREVVVLSYPVEPPELPAGLSSAEREVVLALLRGASNADIAAARGTAPRTVANQIARIFRKLRVSSRMELAAAVSTPKRSRR
jgi:DNA-binding NarL/FixJ family response regulator